MNKLWISLSEKLPKDKERVLTYHCNDSGENWVNLCIWDSKNKKFLFNSLYGNECCFIEFGSEDWPYYEVKEIELWLPISQIMPFN